MALTGSADAAELQRSSGRKSCDLRMTRVSELFRSLLSKS